MIIHLIKIHSCMRKETVGITSATFCLVQRSLHTSMRTQLGNYFTAVNTTGRYVLPQFCKLLLHRAGLNNKFLGI